MPEIAGKFETLAVIKDASDQAKTLFIALIAACAFSWLTISATRDVSLLSNSSTTALPIINVPLPIDDFYMVAPVLLLIAFLYFHLSLQRFWEQLADLPAFFPDGNAADKRVYPWLLSGLMRSKTERLRRDPRAMGRWQMAVSILLAYALAPLTLIGFWGRYLTAHDWIGTAFNAGHGTPVYGADLSNTDVESADLHRMDLGMATFTGATFDLADLREAKFEGSDLTGAGFDGADVGWADFRGAKNLKPEQIRNARFWRSAYYDDDLRNMLGLPDSQNQIVRRLETFLKDAQYTIRSEYYLGLR